MLFPNCYLTNAGRTAILACIGGVCGVTAIAALYIMRGKRRLPLMLCQVAFVTCLVQVGQIISLALEGKPGIATIIFTILACVAGACVSPFVLLWTLVSPTLDLLMMHAKQKVVSDRFKALTLVYLCAQIAIYGTAVGYQYQGDYRTFNVIVSAQFIVVAVYAGVWYAAIKYYSSVLFKHMDALIGSSGERSVAGVKSSSDKIVAHRKRLGL